MNTRRRKTLYLLFVIFIFVAYYIFQQADKTPDSAEYRVIEVLDGDTVVIDDPKRSRVRYLGIDTPEIALEDSPGEPMAKEAWDYNSKLVEGQSVKLEFDEKQYDPYGRILAHVYVDGLLVNEELLKQGFATVLIIEPNDMYSDKIYDAVNLAKSQKKGLWGNLQGLQPPKGYHRFKVEPDDARQFTGENIVVSGEIVGARKSPNVIVLNMEDTLNIVIFPQDWDNFSHFDITPEDHYLGKSVEVIGRVKMHRGKPSINVNHPMLLRSTD
ncbi:MAG: thermonuclease family protein [Thermodesulfobacteriota bacterium]